MLWDEHSQPADGPSVSLPGLRFCAHEIYESPEVNGVKRVCDRYVNSVPAVQHGHNLDDLERGSTEIEEIQGRIAFHSQDRFGQLHCLYFQVRLCSRPSAGITTSGRQDFLITHYAPYRREIISSLASDEYAAIPYPGGTAKPALPYNCYPGII